MKYQESRDWLVILPQVVEETGWLGRDARYGANPFDPEAEREAYQRWDVAITRFHYLHAANIAASLLPLLCKPGTREDRFCGHDTIGRIRRYFAVGTKRHGDILLAWLEAEGFLSIRDDHSYKSLQAEFTGKPLPDAGEAFSSMARGIDRRFFSEPQQPELELTEPATVNQSEIAIG